MPVFLSIRFILEQALIQLEVEEKLETTTLASISIPVAELVWVKKGKEALINGRIFDAKSFETLDNLVTLTGFYDDKETELLEEYKSITEDNNNSPLNESVLKLIFSSVYNNPASVISEADWCTVSTQYYSFTSLLPVAPVLPFIQPPRS